MEEEMGRWRFDGEELSALRHPRLWPGRSMHTPVSRVVGGVAEVEVDDMVVDTRRSFG